LFAADIDTVVVGLETVVGPAALESMCNGHATRVLFSLDLKDGLPLGTPTAWQRPDAQSIVEQAIQLGVRRLLLLDLARVGMRLGTGTDHLAAELLSAHPNLEVAVGGGMRDSADLRRLNSMGIHGVLVASALHDGQIRCEDLASYRRP
jgi:phosphoribosylformimino-5-aminoimidazole carboxamide ribotide isomerase